MPTFDVLKSLEIFLSVTDTGSMTIASRRLGVTQSAISQQIKLLEADLGTALFDRQSRPLRLTTAGITLHQRAARLVLDAKETWTSTRQASEVLFPHLRLAMLSTIAQPLVPAILAAVGRKELSVQSISIMRGISRNHTQDLISHEIDVAITSDALYEHESIERHELMQESFILLLPQSADVRGCDLRALATRLPFLRYTSRTQSGQLIERHFRRLRLDIDPKLMFEAPDDLIAGVAAGYGWSVVTPTQIAYCLTDRSTVQVLPFPKPGLSRSITLITRRGEFPNVATQLATICRRVLRDEVWPRVSAYLPDLPETFRLADESADQLSVSG